MANIAKCENYFKGTEQNTIEGLCLIFYKAGQKLQIMEMIA